MSYEPMIATARRELNQLQAELDAALLSIKAMHQKEIEHMEALHTQRCKKLRMQARAIYEKKAHKDLRVAIEKYISPGKTESGSKNQQYLQEDKPIKERVPLKEKNM